MNIRSLGFCGIIKNRGQSFRNWRVLRNRLNFFAASTTSLLLLLPPLCNTVDVLKVRHILHERILNTRFRSHYRAYRHLHERGDVIYALDVRRINHCDKQLTILLAKRHNLVSLRRILKNLQKLIFVKLNIAQINIWRIRHNCRCVLDNII